MVRKKILIVDDEPQICSLLSERLEKRGFLAQSAFNGKEALGLAKTFQPDLIILDVLMPVMDGFECLHCLKNSAPYASIPVIMLTAKSDSKDVDKGISLQADFYLPKPFEFDNLMHFVNLILK